MGRDNADRQRRTDEVFLFREDRPQQNVVYYGRTDLFTSLSSQPVWQIKRVSRLLNELVTEYANNGKYNCIWDDRTTYFSVVGAGPAIANPLDAYPSGLTLAGKVTVVSINDTTWTLLPASPLADRNAMAIQNQSAVEIKLNYNSGQAGYVGVIVPIGGDRFYDITDSIPIYAKSSSGTVSIITEELS